MIGRPLGHYEILEPLGAGGMGEVYRARDTKLERDVAIKVLPEDFALDQERLARFDREAKVLASMNHANIAAIYGLEESDGVRFIAMECVEGETLADKLAAAGRIEAGEALEIARQITEALEAAHESGVIHRDLKPANVKVTPDGKVKVLDFGLAKAYEADGSPSEISPDLSHSPTVAAATRTGVILGTAAYMSPEQARGKPLDKRTDIWAFGCVLYEMLGGRRAFEGETVSDTMAAILKEEPDWGQVPAGIPWRISELLRRCLQKDPRQRLRDIGDARIEIEEVQSSPGDQDSIRGHAGSPPAWRRGLPWAIAAAAALGLVVGFSLAAILWGGTGSRMTRASVTWLSIPLPEELTTPYVHDNYPNRMVAISPDGSRIALVSGSAGEPLLHIRELDDLALRAIPGTESAYNPFFSSTGDFVCFFTDEGELKKVSLAEGSEPLTVARGIVSSIWAFGSWGDDGTIIYSTFHSGLFAVPQEGGTPVPVSSPRGNEAHLVPQILPGSRAVLFYTARAESTAVQTLPLDEADAVPTTLIEDASHPLYLASGHILYVQEGLPRARPFDLDALAFTGPAFSVPLHVAFDYLGAYDATPQLAVSRNGVLVYAPARTQYGHQTELVWVDREGTEEAFATLDVWRPKFQLSPDNRRLALEYRVGAKVLISLYDMERRVIESTLVTKKTVVGGQPVWTADGSEIITSHPAITSSSMSSVRADGTAPETELFRQEASWLFPFNLSADGKLLAYSYFRADTGSDIGVYEFGENGPAGEVLEFLATDDDEDTPRVSPDGRLIAYVDHSGAGNEIFVKPYPTGEARRVTTASGLAPLWSPDGKELFFQKSNLHGNRTVPGTATELWVVAIETEPELSIGAERLLFSGPLYGGGGDSGYYYDVSNDGRRFLMARRYVEDLQVRELIVVQNWFEVLREWERSGR
jgi:serine/threonine protein kinase/Tol biopolymer transport system component